MSRACARILPRARRMQSSLRKLWEGSIVRFSAAHFERLLRMTTHLGLEFKDVGKRRHGTRRTLFFCDELARIYGSEDPSIALGASFAVENWAAAGFWKELIRGLEIFKKRETPTLPLFQRRDRPEVKVYAVPVHRPRMMPVQTLFTRSNWNRATSLRSRRSRPRNSPLSAISVRF